MLAVECPGCGQANQFPDAFMGMVMLCKHCTHRLPTLGTTEALTAKPGEALLPRLREALRETPSPQRSTSIIPLPPPSEVPDLESVAQRYAAPPLVLASRLSRLGARLLDQGLMTGAAVVGIVVFDPLGEAEGPASPLVYLFPGLFGLLQVYLLSRQGQTVGKLLLGIQIVDAEKYLPVGFVRGFLLREVVNRIPMAIPFVGLGYLLADSLSILGSEERCLHDYIAGTRVVTLW